MKFKKFGEKLQQIEQMEPPRLTKSNETYHKTHPLILIGDNYNDPVWFETNTKKEIFGVSYRKKFTLGESLIKSFSSSRINLGFRPISEIKIFKKSGKETTITKRYFEEIWNKAKNLVKNHKDPFKQVNYKIIGKITYDYHKGYNTIGEYTTPNDELVAKGWKEEKRQKIKAPSHLSYILPIIKHLLGDEIIE